MRKYFAPQKDITAFELAMCLGPTGGIGDAVYSGIKFDDETWAKLPDAIRRHWSDVRVPLEDLLARNVE